MAFNMFEMVVLQIRQELLERMYYLYHGVAWSIPLLCIIIGIEALYESYWIPIGIIILHLDGRIVSGADSEPTWLYSMLADNSMGLGNLLQLG